MPSNFLTLCHSLLLLPSIFPSIRFFTNESVLCIRWLKYWSFSSSISPSNEYSGLISFRMDWLDLLAVQGTLKSLLQHHSSKASVIHGLAFFTIQVSHPTMTSGKTNTLKILTFFNIMMSLLFQYTVSVQFSRPGLPVYYQLLELAQTHVCQVTDAIHPSHPLSSPSPPALHLSQHQGLFQWVSSSHQVVKVLEFQLQHQSFQWIFRTDFL